jgi:hypothetical protein
MNITEDDFLFSSLDLCQHLDSLVVIPTIDVVESLSGSGGAYLDTNNSITDSQITVSDFAFSFYHLALSVVLNRHAPIRCCTRSRPTVAWWSNEINGLRRTMRRAEKKWRRTGLDVFRDEFLKCKLALHKAIKVAKETYLKNVLEELSDNPKSLWKQLNSALGRTTPCPLPRHDCSLDLANNVNKFFVEKVDRVVAECATSNQKYPSSSIPPSGTFSSFRMLTCHEVDKLVRSSPSKSDIMDPVPAWFIKLHLKVFLPVLTSLVNCALSFGMPIFYKHAIIRPLLKKNGLDVDDFSSYRPVSGLSFLSKIIEKAAAHQLTNHLNLTQAFDPQQHAYRTNHSCETAITSVLCRAFNAMDKGKITVLALLDLTSAFDTVDHLSLCRILECAGLSTEVLSWFSQYLSGRCQSVVIQSSISDVVFLPNGVPQGSVLGPLLFSVYVRGVSDVIKQHNIDYTIYADDIQLSISSKYSTLSEASSSLEHCMLHVKSFLSSLSLRLNDNKTEVIFLGSRQLIARCSQTYFKFGEVDIPLSSHVKDLGVIIDNSLSFERHISKVRSSCFSHMRIIGRIRRSLSTRDCLMLLHSLVVSRILYCASIYNGISAKQQRRLQSIINSAMRLAIGLRKTDSITASLVQHGWLSVEQLVYLHTASLIHGIYWSGLPVSLSSALVSHVPSRKMRSSDRGLLTIHGPRSEMGSRSFYIYAPAVWNSLPDTARAIANKISFKTCVKKFLSDELHV